MSAAVAALPVLVGTSPVINAGTVLVGSPVKDERDSGPKPTPFRCESEQHSGLKANAVPVGRRTVWGLAGMVFGLERNVFHRRTGKRGRSALDN
jgi:hypothetical protein